MPINNATNDPGVPHLSLGGGTMTGDLILNADPTLALGASTKSYVDVSEPIGALQYFATGGSAGATYPNPKWLQCQGQTVSQATYPTLFARLGLLNPGGSIWTLGATSQTLTALSHNGSIFASVSPSAAYTSTDASTWTIRPLNSVSANESIAYGNSTFVTVGDNGYVQTSTDAISWYTNNPAIGQALSLATGGQAVPLNGQIVTVGNKFYTSTDAVNYKSVFNGTNTNIGGPGYNAVTYGNSTYVAVGPSGNISTSTDANTWSTVNSGTSSTMATITFNGTIFSSGGLGGRLQTSTDGISWTARTSNTTNAIQSMAFGAGVFVFSAQSGVFSSSTDGITWTTRTSGTTSSSLNMIYGNSLFVGVGTGGLINTSTDGTTWVVKTSGTASNLNSVTFGGAAYAAVGAGGVILSSPDATTWTPRTSGTTTILNSVWYFSGNYYAASTGGLMLTSTDATTWINVNPSGTTSTLNAVTFGNGLFLAGGNGGALLTTTNGKTWTSRTSGTTSTINQLIYGSVYTAVGQGGVILSSTDAITWTIRASGTTSTLTGLAYSGSLYMATGAATSTQGYVGTSTDATSWNTQTTLTTSTITAVAYGNGNYVIQDSSQQIQTSTNGVFWTQQISASSGNLATGTMIHAAGKFVSKVISTVQISLDTYAYNSATQFVLPTENQNTPTNQNLTLEYYSNFKRNLFIKAL